jgi:2-polyprenyl-6-methoxyphenol hydroxylase-like FAD-dependent oxidoreductase
MAGRRVRNHAVVIGSSVAGLLAAKVLSEAYDKVTIFERDELVDRARPRRGVPQGRHAHVLLGSGSQAIEDLLPGITGELLSAGAKSCKSLAQIRFVVAGHQLTRQAQGSDVLLASRPLIETAIRKRVVALPNVALRAQSVVAELMTSPDRAQVVGVLVDSSLGQQSRERVTADLVVAASGRSAQVPAWLASLGYPRPRQDRLQVDLLYVSRRIRLPPHRLGGAKLIGIGPRPGLPRGLMLIEQEDHWIVTASGYGVEHHPPTNDHAFVPFLRSVAPADVLATVCEGEWLGELVSHAFPANQRRRYEQLRRFPDGLLAVGDAVASFNPLYGQGMSVAALEAKELRRCLQGGGQGVARRFFRSTAKVVDQAWDLAVGGDLALPDVAGDRPLSLRITNAYLEQLLKAAEHDTHVAGIYNQVGDLLARPESLLHPYVLWRVFRGSRSAGTPTAA